MLYNASLVCEGGAMGGIYTAGVLDVLMGHDICFTHAIGVSIGSCNVIDFAAHQIGRTIDCMAVKDKSIVYMGLPSLLRRRKFYDFELCFEGFADKYIPFDYEAFAKSPVQTEVVATDCETGKPVYIKCSAEDKQVIRASRASASLPFFSKIYDFEGIQCLDGGIAKSIPIERAMSYGNDKIIVVLTKEPEYRKAPISSFRRRLISKTYQGYPELIKTMENRYYDYNTDIELVEQLERDGKAFVFRPARRLVSRHESNYDKLRKGYAVGIADAEKRFDELREYLNR